MSGGGEPPGRRDSILARRCVSQAPKEAAGLGAAERTTHSPNGHGDLGSGHRVSCWEHPEILTTAREGDRLLPRLTGGLLAKAQPQSRGQAPNRAGRSESRPCWSLTQREASPALL